MEVEILHLVAGAKAARGVAVVIDVFRAFTTACFVLGHGAESILAVGELGTALALKAAHPDYLLIGERQGAAPPGFDFGNSPAALEHISLAGRTVIQTTSAGTQGLVNAEHADAVITGAFVNAGAVVRYLRMRNPARVSLVCMGREALEPTGEDTACAEFIRDLLRGDAPDFDTIRKHLRTIGSARKFFDPEIVWAPERDFDLCLTRDRFDFVLQGARVGKNVCRLSRVDV